MFREKEKQDGASETRNSGGVLFNFCTFNTVKHETKDLFHFFTLTFKVSWTSTSMMHCANILY